MLTYAGAITIAILCAPTFAVYASVSLDLALELTACLAIAASIGVTFPDLFVAIGIAVNLTIGINLAITLGLPSFTAALSVAFNAQLLLVLGLIAALELALDVGDVSLQAFTFSGAGSSLGADLGGAFADGTPSTSNVEAIVFGATSSGTIGAGSVSTVTLLGGGHNYESGLCSVAFSAPPPGGVVATGTPVLSGGSITGVTLTGNGLGYSAKSPPTVTISDAAPVLGASNASPIVLTLADTTGVSALTVAGALGNTGANGSWCAKILSPSTVALYQDGAFTIPSVGTGVYTSGGTAKGIGAGAAASVVMGGGAQAQLQGFFDGLLFGPGAVSAGSIELASICGGAFDLLVALLGNLQLQAKLMASVKLDFGIVPPTFAGDATVVAGIDANLTAAAKIEPPLPSIQAKIGARISGQASIVLDLVSRIGLILGFATEELEVFTYSGPGSGLAPALTTALSSGWPDGTPPTSFTNATILVATTPAASAALSTFFPGA